MVPRERPRVFSWDSRPLDAWDTARHALRARSCLLCQPGFSVDRLLSVLSTPALTSLLLRAPGPQSLILPRAQADLPWSWPCHFLEVGWQRHWALGTNRSGQGQPSASAVVWNGRLGLTWG